MTSAKSLAIFLVLPNAEITRNVNWELAPEEEINCNPLPLSSQLCHPGDGTDDAEGSSSLRREEDQIVEVKTAQTLSPVTARGIASSDTTNRRLKMKNWFGRLRQEITKVLRWILRNQALLRVVLRVGVYIYRILKYIYS